MDRHFLRPGKLAHFKWPVFVAVVSLNLIGLLAIWSSTELHSGSISSLLSSVTIRQCIYSLVGLTALFVTVLLDYTLFREWAWAIYLFANLLLVYVLVAGKTIESTRRWISLGPINVQPSEIAKIAVIIILGWYVMYEENLDSFKKILTSLVLALIPTLLIAMEPDLGTAVLFAPVWFSIMFVAGLPQKYIYAGAGAVLILIPAAYFTVLEEYQRDRIKGFIQPEKAPLDEGYHLLRSTTAIGSGGVTGRKFGHFSDEYSKLVPLRHNDFIFTVIGEEFGFVGSSFVLCLYGVLIFFCFRFAYVVREPFGRLICVGIGTLIAAQTFINIGMTVGLAPITGLPLPFISYGGSSLVSSYFAVGLLLSVRASSLPSFSEHDQPGEESTIRETGFHVRSSEESHT